VLDSIKADRTLSFGHWRYRLLHWAFGVADADPARPQDTGLPKYLYTHYCPLFHLTNLIALLLPLLLAVKVGRAVFRGVRAAWGASRVGDGLTAVGSFLRGLLARRPEREPAAEVAPTLRQERAHFAARLTELLRNWSSGSYKEFDTVWTFLKHEFPYALLVPEEARALHALLVDRYEAAKARAEARRAALRARLVFWSNFSRAFVKWGLYALYAVLAVAAAYLLYEAVLFLAWALYWICQGIAWLFSAEGTGAAFWFLARMLFWGILAGGAAYFVRSRRTTWDVLGRVWDHVKVVGYPLYVVPAFGRFVARGWAGAVEFATMFYEENCPAITLVSEEEAAAEAAAEEATLR
jgi:hypothetical protein